MHSTAVVEISVYTAGLHCKTWGLNQIAHWRQQSQRTKAWWVSSKYFTHVTVWYSATMRRWTGISGVHILPLEKHHNIHWTTLLRFITASKRTLRP